MPFLWKKTRSKRFSQLVADHIHSSKHGSSLVVETGFPASLVDLYHKNRDRLKKRAQKRRSTDSNPVTVTPSSGLNLSSNSLPDSSQSDSKLANSQKCSSKLAFQENSLAKMANQENHSTNPIGDVVVSDKNSADKAVKDGNKVFVVICKILFMVVLVLGSKRLVLGISMSAFSLFLLEYVGKYVYELLEPCLNSQFFFKVMVGCKGGKLEGECVDSDCGDLAKGRNFNVSKAEIQISPAESNLDSEVEEIIHLHCNKRLQFEEMDLKKMAFEKDCECDVLEPKQKGCRRAKLRSQLKKLVPKKLHKSKKKGSVSKSEVPYSMKEDIHEEKKVEQCEVREEVCANGKENISEKTSDVCDVHRDLEASILMVKAGRKREGTFGYWVLCLVVLSGLVGGRILAIVITLCWSLMSRRRCIELPVLRSSSA